MNKNIYRILLPGMFLGSLLWLTGCYTQLATTRDEGRYDYSAAEDDTTGNNYEQAYADSDFNGGYYDDNGEVPGYRYGFDYYYPTVGFGFSTYDLWYSRYNGWYYYDPFICGTYYPSIYAGWYPYWRYPGYNFYPYNYHHTYAGTLGRGGYGGVRTIGSTRGGNAVRGGNEGGYRGAPASGASNLPTGYRSSSGTRSNPPAATPRVSTGRRSDGARGKSAVRSGSRSGTTRSGGGRQSRGQAPRTYTPPRNTGGSGRSYSPPPSPPPAQSTPPSSGGGRSSSGSSGGGRGGRR